MVNKTKMEGKMMLSQLNLRFHKKLIEALKVRAGRENTSVNALAERFLDDGLKSCRFRSACRGQNHSTYDENL